MKQILSIKLILSRYATDLIRWACNPAQTGTLRPEAINMRAPPSNQVRSSHSKNPFTQVIALTDLSIGVPCRYSPPTVQIRESRSCPHHSQHADPHTNRSIKVGFIHDPSPHPISEFQVRKIIIYIFLPLM